MLTLLQITETLVDKESRLPEPSLRPSKETDSKIQKYITGYMERLKQDPEYPNNLRREPAKPKA